jgi:hypothetical protein
MSAGKKKKAISDTMTDDSSLISASSSPLSSSFGVPSVLDNPFNQPKVIVTGIASSSASSSSGPGPKSPISSLTNSKTTTTPTASSSSSASKVEPMFGINVMVVLGGKENENSKNFVERNQLDIGSKDAVETLFTEVESKFSISNVRQLKCYQPVTTTLTRKLETWLNLVNETLDSKENQHKIDLKTQVFILNVEKPKTWKDFAAAQSSSAASLAMFNGSPSSSSSSSNIRPRPTYSASPFDDPDDTVSVEKDNDEDDSDTTKYDATQDVFTCHYQELTKLNNAICNKYSQFKENVELQRACQRFHSEVSLLDQLLRLNGQRTSKHFRTFMNKGVELIQIAENVKGQRKQMVHLIIQFLPDLGPEPSEIVIDTLVGIWKQECNIRQAAEKKAKAAKLKLNTTTTAVTQNNAAVVVSSVQQPSK